MVGPSTRGMECVAPHVIGYTNSLSGSYHGAPGPSSGSGVRTGSLSACAKAGSRDTLVARLRLAGLSSQVEESVPVAVPSDLSPAEATPSTHRKVVVQALHSYRSGGDLAIPFWEARIQKNQPAVPDLFLPGLRRVEEVETEETLENYDLSRLRNYTSHGLEVWVLVPLSRMAQAHDIFRGVATRIQAWWIEGSKLRFGRPERP